MQLHYVCFSDSLRRRTYIRFFIWLSFGALSGIAVACILSRLTGGNTALVLAEQPEDLRISVRTICAAFWFPILTALAAYFEKQVPVLFCMGLRGFFTAAVVSVLSCFRIHVTPFLCFELCSVLIPLPIQMYTAERLLNRGDEGLPRKSCFGLWGLNLTVYTLIWMISVLLP